MTILRKFLPAKFLAMAWFSVVFIFPQSSVSKPDSPNVIVIVADDLGWGDLSCYPQVSSLPEVVVKTPHLDRMAAEGVRFTQAYATSCVCAPSRAALLTGRYQASFGFYEFKETLAGIPKTEKMMAECLKDKNYATGMFGKWHLGDRIDLGPTHRGFDRFFGFLGGQHDYYDPRLGDPICGFSFDYDAYVFDQETPAKEVDYLTHEFTRHAMSFIEENAKAHKPFFIYLPYSAPHPPMQSPWEDLEPYTKSKNGKFSSRDIARAMINVLDSDIGKIQALLKTLNIDENTIIVFTSDNGGADDTWEGEPLKGGCGLVQHNGGLRPRKGFLWEGGIRIPMIIRWPGRIPKGIEFKTPVSHLDIFPTILAATGSEDLPKKFDGINLLPYLEKGDQILPERILYWGFDPGVGRWAIRKGKWKLTRDIPDTIAQNERPIRFVRELHDLDTDPFEKKDLSIEFPDVVKDLQESIDSIYKTLPPTLATPTLMEAWREDMKKRKEKLPNSDALRRDGAPRHWLQ